MNQSLNKNKQSGDYLKYGPNGLKQINQHSSFIQVQYHQLHSVPYPKCGNAFQINNKLEDQKQKRQSPNQVKQQFKSNVTSLSKIYKNSGIIRSQWLSKKGKLQVICYGSGFAISKRIILTCAHNIYLDNRQRVCSKVTFIPDFIEGNIQKEQLIFQSVSTNFLNFQLPKPEKGYTKCSSAQDIALVYVSQDMNFQHFPEVGLQNPNKAIFGSQLFIAGYPSLTYYKEVNLRNIYFKREQLKGILNQINKDIIVHNLNTKTGMSGSSIVSFNGNGSTILGVHTHRGKYSNYGTYLSRNVLERLIQYQIDFAIKHKHYDFSAKFPRKMKQYVLENRQMQANDKIYLQNLMKCQLQKYKANYKEEQIMDTSDLSHSKGHRSNAKRQAQSNINQQLLLQNQIKLLWHQNQDNIKLIDFSKVNQAILQTLRKFMESTNKFIQYFVALTTQKSKTFQQQFKQKVQQIQFHNTAIQKQIQQLNASMSSKLSNSNSLRKFVSVEDHKLIIQHQCKQIEELKHCQFLLEPQDDEIDESILRMYEQCVLQYKQNKNYEESFL